jgi:hypothetical protein
MRLSTPLLAGLLLAVLTLPAHSGPVKAVAKGSVNVVKGVGKGVVQVGRGVVKGTSVVVKGTVRGVGCIVTLGTSCKAPK